MNTIEEQLKNSNKEELCSFFESNPEIKRPTFLAFGLCQNLSELYNRIIKNKCWLEDLKNEKQFHINWEIDLYSNDRNLENFIKSLYEIIISIAGKDSDFYMEVIRWSLDKNVILINEMIFWD